MPDILAGQQPRSTTSVPGLWILDAPSSFSVRVFSAPPLVDPAAPTSAPGSPVSVSAHTPAKSAAPSVAASAHAARADPGVVLDRLRSDALEHAWLSVNAHTGAPTQVLCGACAVVKPASEGGQRELWVFYPSDSEPNLDLGLSEVEPRPEPIDVEKTLLCTEHNSSLSCLSPTATCQPQWQPPEAWTYLEAAAGEKLAWGLGTRIALLPSALTVAEPPFAVSLRPTPSGQLLLSARPRIAKCAPGPSAAGPYVLRPLALPALLVAAYCTSAAQDARLCAAFDAALGSGWKAGRAEARVAAQALAQTSAEWSVYFVPLDVQVDEHMLPASIVGRWRGAEGVLTIWPTHLARPLAPPRKMPVPRPPAVPAGVGTPPDLLATAAGLYDFFGSYTAPSEEDDDDDAEEVEGPSLAEIEAPVVGDGDDSTHDLFSAQSSPQSPPQSVADSRREGTEAAGELFPSSAFASPRDEDMDVDDLFDDVETPHQPEPEPPKDEPTPVPDIVPVPPPTQPITQASSRVTSPRHFSITEDDFNFFDSPAMNLLTPHDHPSIPLDHMDGAEHAELMPDLEELMRPTPEVKAVEIEEVHVDVDPAVQELLNPKEAVVMETVEEAEEVMEVVEVKKEEPPAKRPRFADLVPAAFAPLPLGARRSSKFAYGLPSPAPTISALRLELVDRLRKSTAGEQKFDYAAAWELDSDASETDLDSAMTTGAPPTPTSETSFEDHNAPTRAPSAAPGPAPDDEVEYDGTLCVGGEWSSLKDDAAAAAALARTWGSSWADAPPTEAYPPSPVSPKPKDDPLATLDFEALANAAVRNRFFRTIFDDDTLPVPPPPALLVKSGTALAQLAAGPDETSFALPQPSMNVAFGSAVLRLSVAGLRYWRELGLSPAGGPKDISAFVVCEPGAETERAAATFLRDMGEVYSAHMMGRHAPGSEDGKGVVPTPNSEVGDTLARLRAKATSTTVIYVLRTIPLSSAVATLLAPANPLCITYPVPVTSVRVPNLTSIAFEVYDSIPRKLTRVLLHGKPLDAPPAWLPYHAFTLAPDTDPKPELSMAWPQRNYDVFNRWRQVHGCYAYVSALDVLLLAVVDAQGENCEVKAIRLEPGSSLADRVRTAWEVFATFAKVAAAEWRLSVCHYGLLAKEEWDEWSKLTQTHKDPFSLLCVELPPEAPARPAPPVANIPPMTFADPNAMIVDETLVGGTAKFSSRLALALPPPAASSRSSSASASPPPKAGETAFPHTSFLLSLASRTGAGASTATYHVLIHRPPPGAGYADEQAASVFSSAYYHLACIGRRRCDLGYAPLQVDAVGVALRAVTAMAKCAGVD